MKTSKVVIDTNALIYAVQKKRDLFEDLTKYLGSFELIVLERVKEELKRKMQSGKGVKTNAKIALEMLDKMKIVRYGSENELVDDLIVKYAAENDAYVYTHDRKIKEKCKKKKIKLVRIEAFERKRLA